MVSVRVSELQMVSGFLSFSSEILDHEALVVEEKFYLSQGMLMALQSQMIFYLAIFTVN